MPFVSDSDRGVNGRMGEKSPGLMMNCVCMCALMAVVA